MNNQSPCQRILSNKAQCRLCGDIIESRHRHDFRWCKCGEIAVDGGLDYLRRCAKNAFSVIELSNTIENSNE